MCGRYAIDYPDEFAARFGLDDLPDGLEPNYNAAPGQFLPVIIKLDDQINSLEIMRWGLVPFWSKDEKIGYKMINARAESINQKPSFRKPFASQRCLVPAMGFYEWKKLGNAKQPYFIKPKNNSLISMAGLYDHWKTTDGKILKTYTIITTQPNEIVKLIHNRMPVILNPETEKLWLDQDREQSSLLEILQPAPENDLSAFMVSKSVNNPEIQGEELVRPLQ